MAIDSRNKRASAIYVGLPWRGLLPAPDNTIDQADRQQVGLMYAGIASGSPVSLPGDVSEGQRSGKGVSERDVRRNQVMAVSVRRNQVTEN